MIEQSPNFTSNELKFSYWYITHKLLLRKIAIIFLIVLIAFMWFYILFQLAVYVLEYNQNVQAIRQSLFNKKVFAEYFEGVRPVPIDFSGVESFSVDNQKIDFIFQAKNSNQNWLVEFNYQLKGADNQSRMAKGFVLPGESKYLLGGLGLMMQDAKLEISNIKWIRIPDPEGVLAQRNKLLITNKVFNSSGKTGDPSIATFEIDNNSGFSYYKVGLQIFLYSHQQIVGVNYLEINNLRAGEKRNITVNWPEAYPSADSMEIVPEINFFDEDNIMPVNR